MLMFLILLNFVFSDRGLYSNLISNRGFKCNIVRAPHKEKGTNVSYCFFFEVFVT